MCTGNHAPHWHRVPYETIDEKSGNQRYIARVALHNFDLYPPPDELYREPSWGKIGSGGLLDPARSFRSRLNERLSQQTEK